MAVIKGWKKYKNSKNTEAWEFFKGDDVVASRYIAKTGGKGKTTNVFFGRSMSGATFSTTHKKPADAKAKAILFMKKVSKSYFKK